MRLKDIGEINLIKRLSKNFRLDKSVIKGPGDDAAVIRWTKDRHLLFTCDMLIEDVHFTLKSATPFQIGWKALGRNISDIAAMGGVPRYAVVSMGIGSGSGVSLADGICRGIKAIADRFNVSIVGGDMSNSKKIVIDISLMGEVEKNNVAFRSGAQGGDVILVTGALGGSIKGRHLKFIPRVEEARRLVKDFKINSMIDISDGLILDLWRILDSSGAGGRIYKSLIPISKDADFFDKAITEGEDFELLFTMSAKEAKRFFKTSLSKWETPVTLIGEVMDKKYGYKLIEEDGRAKRLEIRGYLHF